MDDDVQRLLSERRYEESFDMLLDRYQDKVLRLARAMLRDPAQAEDTAQDIFLKLWRALPDYNRRASPSTWLYTIARNTCLSQLRHNAYRKTLSLEELAVQAKVDRQHHTSPQTTASYDVKKLLARLPDKNRQVLALFYLQDKSYNEVAIMMDMPLGTVKSCIHRARKELAEMLSNPKGNASSEARDENLGVNQ